MTQLMGALPYFPGVLISVGEDCAEPSTVRPSCIDGALLGAWLALPLCGGVFGPRRTRRLPLRSRPCSNARAANLRVRDEDAQRDVEEHRSYRRGGGR